MLASPPPDTSHSLLGAPGFRFSQTMGFDPQDVCCAKRRGLRSRAPPERTIKVITAARRAVRNNDAVLSMECVIDGWSARGQTSSVRAESATVGPLRARTP